MRRLIVHTANAIALAALLGLIGISVPAHQPSGHHGAVAVAMPGIAAGLTGAPSRHASNVATDGRWKLGGDGSCYWDPDDGGPDQCSQTMGRWKEGGDGSCYWDPNDSGPNQCAPPAPASPVEARALSTRAAFRPGA